MKVIKIYGALIALGLILGAFAGLFIKLSNTQHQYEVMQACSRSRTVINGTLENICGNLQDRYNIEFICDSLDAYAYCQAEVK